MGIHLKQESDTTKVVSHKKYPCPACHDNKLSEQEANNRRWVCEDCYERISDSMNEGMFYQ